MKKKVYCLVNKERNSFLLKEEELLAKYILESIKDSKKPNSREKFNDFKDNFIARINPRYLFAKKEEEYHSPPKVFEKKHDVIGLSQEYTFPDGMSNKDFEKNILCWDNVRAKNFQFNLEKEHSKPNSLSTKDFKFILDNNPFIKDLLSKVSFKSCSYSKQRYIVFATLMGMTSCFNESDIEFFLLMRYANSKAHLSQEYNDILNKILDIINDNGVGWLPSIDTMENIYRQLNKGSSN